MSSPQGERGSWVRELHVLTVESIDLHYGAAQALRHVSVAAEPGKITCVLGRNGVGKSSLLRAIVGHQPVSAGKILFDGQDVTKLKAYERARRGVAYVPQGREIFPLLTVQENLETGYARLPRPERKIGGELFELFPVLKSMLGRRGGDLSGGQQQQLAIGRALVTRPKILVLRRADRRHSAVDHQGYRPRNQISQGFHRYGDPAGRAISGFLP